MLSTRVPLVETGTNAVNPVTPVMFVPVVIGVALTRDPEATIGVSGKIGDVFAAIKSLRKIDQG